MAPLTLQVASRPSGCGAEPVLEQCFADRQRFLDLSRSADGAETLVREKLRACHLRSRRAETLLASAEAQSDADGEALAAAFEALGVALTESQLQRLERVLGPGEPLARIRAAQGLRSACTPSLHALAGPDLDLPIEVNRSSPWTLERWSREPRFSEYHFEDDGVRYRGLHLHPGDVLVANVNLDGNFIFTACFEPKSYCPHAAVVAILELDGRRWPVAVETYEKGVRAVPLNLFLNPRYIAYAEVYRHRQLGSGRLSAISELALRLVRETSGYNFVTEDPDRRYMACTTVPRSVLEDLGLGRLPARSGARSPGVRENLLKLDYPHFESFMSPVDFVLHEDLEPVGWIDNNQFDALLARELVEDRFMACMRRGDLNPGRLPLMTRLNRFGIRQMRAGSLLGRLMSKVMGFDDVSLPRGPELLMAAVEPMEAEMSRGVRRMLPYVRERLQREDAFDLDAWLGDDEVRARLERALDPRWL